MILALSRGSLPSRAQRRVAASLVAISLAASLAACSGTAAGPGQAPTTGPDPEFTGPWAADLKYAYDASDNELGRQVLADSVITDMEFQEAMELVRECYAAAGYSVEYDRYGFETVTSLDEEGDPLAAMGSCAFADGGVTVLYYKMVRNPANLDEESLMAECLVDRGVVEQGFTGQDFAEAMMSGRPPWNSDDERVIGCSQDPLGLIDGAAE